MVQRLRVFGIVLLTLLVALPAAANSLFIGQTGDWAEYLASDILGNTWTVKMEILEKQVVNSIEYYNTRISNRDPLGVQPDDSEFLGRFTSTAAIAYYNNDEYIAFQTAAVGTRWETPSSGPGNPVEYREIVAIENVTVPYGTFTAYKNYHYSIDIGADPDDPGTVKHTHSYFWVVEDNPAAGLIRMEEYKDIRAGSEPHIWELAAVHHAPAVPIPSAILLFGTGLAGLAFSRRR